MTIPAPVSHAVQVLQEWLKELRDKGELADEAAAYSVLQIGAPPAPRSLNPRGGRRS